ncbi:MAG: threonine ammonia-lyase [Alphaproteobacteria bacterium]|nr:threonine ammonia-lyase [Alphaproteobacteria bacterium]
MPGSVPPPAPPDPAALRQAGELLLGEVLRTPCLPAPALSREAGCELFLKLENLQLTGSFKARGALVKLASLDPAARRRGVIAMSAGNHAQGVAYHAGWMGVPATIVMPRGTPNLKVRQTRALGAEVRLLGDSVEEAAAAARALREQADLTFVHPYDDPLIVAGQATVTLEIPAELPRLDALVVPVGGGGLLAGACLAMAAERPGLVIYGVQSAQYPAFVQALGGQPSRCGGAELAEGIAVKAPGQLTLAYVRGRLAGLLTVADDAIERAIDLTIAGSRTVPEGAGAAALAAVLAERHLFVGRRVCLIVSGGNIDPRLLSGLLLRGLVREGCIAKLRVEIPDSPGTLAAVARLIGEADGNILEVSHQRLLPGVPAKLADLDVLVETEDPAHVAAIVARLAGVGYRLRRLTETDFES